MGKHGYKTFSEVFGFGSSKMHRLLVRCASDCFGMSEDEFYTDHWVQNEGTSELIRSNRPWVTPSAAALDKRWRATRDCNWLYTHPDYKWDSVNCSIYCSPGSALGLVKWLGSNEYQPRRIMDFGAGPGFTSILLAANLPNTEIHHVEINPELKAMCRWFARELGLDNVKTVNEAEGEYDVISAFEVIEHFQAEGLVGVGDPMTPTDQHLLSHAHDDTVFSYATEWGAEKNYQALGHFREYTFDGKQVGFLNQPGAQFNKAMKRRGWKKVWQGFNGKPKVFLRTGE